jgi:hypothetical protein
MVAVQQVERMLLKKELPALVDMHVQCGKYLRPSGIKR